jgi:transposase-like protein
MNETTDGGVNFHGEHSRPLSPQRKTTYPLAGFYTGAADQNGAASWPTFSPPYTAEPIWTEFLRKLTRRGLRGVKLVVSDAHEGLKAAVTKVLTATWQRCRVHFMRNVLAHAGKSGRRVVSAFIATAFAQETPEAASVQWRAVADQIRPKVPKLATIMDEAEPDVLAYMTFPKEHRAKLHSTNPIERLNGEIKRRTEVVGIFPNDDAIVRLVGALLLEQNDEWAVQRARYMTLETIGQMSDDPLISLPAVAR